MDILLILSNFEHLATQAIFPSNKDILLQATELYDILKNNCNQQIRNILSDDLEQFADMSRVFR